MGRIESNVLYVRLKCILSACPECGGPVPLDTAAAEALCPRCQSRFRVPARLWGEGLGFMDDMDWFLSSDDMDPEKVAVKEVDAEGFKLRVEFSRTPPRCIHCGGALAIGDEREVGGEAFRTGCPSCGKVNSFSRPPEWLTSLHGHLTHMNAEESGQGAGPPRREEAGRSAPVLMQCPNCKAQLNITEESKRLVRCEFCGASVHLPDEIWGVFHPVKKTSDWLARLEVGAASFSVSARNHVLASLAGFLWFGLGVGFIVAGVAMWKEAVGGAITMFIVGTILFLVPGAVMVITFFSMALERYRLASRFRE